MRRGWVTADPDDCRGGEFAGVFGPEIGEDSGFVDFVEVDEVEGVGFDLEVLDGFWVAMGTLEVPIDEVVAVFGCRLVFSDVGHEEAIADGVDDEIEFGGVG